MSKNRVRMAIGVALVALASTVLPGGSGVPATAAAALPVAYYRFSTARARRLRAGSPPCSA